jgi:hypothetical protein
MTKNTMLLANICVNTYFFRPYLAIDKINPLFEGSSSQNIAKMVFSESIPIEILLPIATLKF